MTAPSKAAMDAAERFWRGSHRGEPDAGALRYIEKHARALDEFASARLTEFISGAIAESQRTNESRDGAVFRDELRTQAQNNGIRWSKL